MELRLLERNYLGHESCVAGRPEARFGLGTSNAACIMLHNACLFFDMAQSCEFKYFEIEHGPL